MVRSTVMYKAADWLMARSTVMYKEADWISCQFKSLRILFNASLLLLGL